MSSIETLAKNPGPAAIVVLLLRADGSGMAGYVIHLIGQQLARVLRRRRRAHASAQLDVNHASINFAYRKVEMHFEFTPAGLRSALEAVTRSEGPGYVIEKRGQS